MDFQSVNDEKGKTIEILFLLVNGKKLNVKSINQKVLKSLLRKKY